MKLKPLGSNVLIHPIADPNTSSSGLLLLPQQSAQRIDNGIVIARGPKVSDDISIGDHVTFSGYSGEEISIEDVGFFILVPEKYLNAILTLESPVILIDTITCIRIIRDRISELKQRDTEVSLDEIAASLEDRVKDLTISEGFQF